VVSVDPGALLTVTSDLRALVQKLDSRVQALEKGSKGGAPAAAAATASTADDDDDDFELFGDDDDEVS